MPILAKLEYSCVLQDGIKAISAWLCHQALQRAHPSHDVDKQCIFAFWSNGTHKSCGLLPSACGAKRFLYAYHDCSLSFRSMPVFALYIYTCLYGWMSAHYKWIVYASAFSIRNQQKWGNSNRHFFHQCGKKSYLLYGEKFKLALKCTENNSLQILGEPRLLMLCSQLQNEWY